MTHTTAATYYYDTAGFRLMKVYIATLHSKQHVFPGVCIQYIAEYYDQDARRKVVFSYTTVWQMDRTVCSISIV